MVAMVTNFAEKNRLTIEKSPFLTKFKAFGDEFSRRYQHSKIPKKKAFNMLCTMIIRIIC